MATLTERAPAPAPNAITVALKEAAIAAAVMALLAIPLIGFVLEDIPGGVTLVFRTAAVLTSCAIVFAGRFALAMFRGHRPAMLTGLFDTVGMRALGSRIGKLVGPALIGFALVMPMLPFSDRYIVDIGTSVLIYVMLGWGLNIVVGLAGLLDLGYVAFYAVGAYSFALLAGNFDLSFWQCLPLAGLFAAFFGVLLGFPVLRLRGDYLAIVTLGFGEIIRIILLN